MTEQAVGGEIVTPKRRSRRVLRGLVWLLLIPCALWAVVRAAGLEHSFATPFMAATPYIAASSLVPLALAALVRSRTALAAAVATSTLLAFSVLPRAIGSAEAAVGRPLRVLSVNLLFGSADVEEVVGLVRRMKPDVFSAQELTPGMVDRLEAAGLSGLLPYSALEDAPGAQGTGIYGRYPLKPLHGLFTPIGHNMPAASMELPDGSSVEVVAVHTYTPLGRQLSAWEAGLDALPGSSPDVVRVLAGDFNASLDHAAMRRVLDRGYVSAADRVGNGLTGTWPANGRLFPFITIDHVLVPDRVNVVDLSVHDVPGTDHRALLADLRVP
ncbi:endonuclease/exonuclease/phosphatase family protein [Sinosporangium album]|nr:endonuclease/exonuclease/phosphatase family protein [Sinosporangium album]